MPLNTISMGQTSTKNKPGLVNTGSGSPGEGRSSEGGHRRLRNQGFWQPNLVPFGSPRGGSDLSHCRRVRGSLGSNIQHSRHAQWEGEFTALKTVCQGHVQAGVVGSGGRQRLLIGGLGLKLAVKGSVVTVLWGSWGVP